MPRPTKPVWLTLMAVVSVVPLAATAWSQVCGDLPWYFQSAQAWFAGRTPYEEHQFEYPPYAMLAFAPAAWLSSTERGFQITFALQLAFFDLAVKAFLLWLAANRRGFWAYAPFLAYCLFGFVSGYWYLKRFDLIPAALTLASVVAAAKGRPTLAGIAVGLGIGVKIYPVVLLPVLATYAWREGTLRRLGLGLGFSLLPLVPIALQWPFWRAGSFHADRQLQVESLWASWLWLFRDWTEVRWVGGAAAYEVHGGMAAQVLPLALAVWTGGTLLAAALSAAAVIKTPCGDLEFLVAWSLAPLVAFVGLSPVLSPQYLIWITVLAVALLETTHWRIGAILIAAALLTRLTFPASGYQTGISPGLTAILVARNVLLLLGLALLLKQGRTRPSRAQTL